ncbi:MAG: TFIIB-type zinc ribbon-containing protein [Christensenellaceae bacterium]|nr:TFIIB-type zinc ribbon-containing protein [Christensenellaceae bacterium]
MAAITFKCTSCGAFVNFNPDDQNFKCPYCGKDYTEDEIIAKANEIDGEINKNIDTEVEQSSTYSDTNEKLYNCKNCGAQIVADETTVATNCYYCHSPIVLVDKLLREYKPDRLIPFKFNKEEAIKKFHEYVGKKKYVPKEFFSQSQLEKIAGVYYPYWDADYKCDATFDGEGVTVSTVVSGDYNITTTRYYKVIRRGILKFNNIMRNALSKNQRLLADGIHPFDFNDEKDYSSAYFTGFMAEKRDVDKEDVQGNVESEIESYLQPILTRGSSYSKLYGNVNMNILNKSYNYLMLPTWVLTYRGKDNIQYFFSMNGQTGKVCGKLPIDKGKLFLHGIIAAAGVALALLIGGYFLW